MNPGHVVGRSAPSHAALRPRVSGRTQSPQVGGGRCGTDYFTALRTRSSSSRPSSAPHSRTRPTAVRRSPDGREVICRRCGAAGDPTAPGSFAAVMPRGMWLRGCQDGRALSNHVNPVVVAFGHCCLLRVRRALRCSPPAPRRAARLCRVRASPPPPRLPHARGPPRTLRRVRRAFLPPRLHGWRCATTQRELRGMLTSKQLRGADSC